MTASRDTTSRDTTSRETTSNAAEELESLLEFVYMFPVGLIEFRYSGQIARLNPEAVRLLAPVLAAMEFENVFVCFGSLWPELRDAVRALSQPGSRLDAHRVKVSASGVTTWLSLTLARVANGSTMLTISDVTREVAVEQDVRDSEERLRALFDSIDEGYCVAEMIVDDEGNAVDYRVLEVNPLFEEMTGLRGALGRTALELVPDLEPVWVQTYARTALGRETQRFEQGSDVMGRWFEVFCTPVAPTGRFAIEIGRAHV